MHGGIGCVHGIPDLNLSLLAPLMAALKQTENFIRQVGQWWGKDRRSIVWQLTVRLYWIKQTCQPECLTIHVQDFLHMREHHDSRSCSLNLSIVHVALRLLHAV